MTLRKMVIGILAATAIGAAALPASAQTTAPPNDNFANATVISGPRGIITGSNAGSTGETDEPAGSSTLNTV
jgi:hypothetical protein